MSTVVILLLAYLLGSIPTAVIAGKLFFHIDVREHGSGNAGATNTIRVLGAWVGMAVLLLDMFKGWMAVSLISFFPQLLSPSIDPNLLEVFLALAAVLGHIFPLFAGFRGGKGVATFLGTAFGIFPLTFLCAIGAFLLVFIPTRYVSLGSILASITMPLFAWIVFKEPWASVFFSVIVALVIPITHHKNIKRLIRGEEKKLALKRKGAARNQAE